MPGRWNRGQAKMRGFCWIKTPSKTLLIVLLLMAADMMGFDDHPALARSQGVELFSELQGYVEDHAQGLPDVAAPPRR